MTRILEVEKPRVCIHAASVVMDRRSVFAPDEFVLVNVLGTQRLLSAITNTGTVEHLVYISSRSATGQTPTARDLMSETDLPRPINPYGASKAAAEMFLSCLLPRYRSARFGVSYGTYVRPERAPRYDAETAS